MTQIECRACTAAGDAPLCRDCTQQLAAALKKLPGLIADLEVAVTRRARLDQPARIQVQLPPEWTQADAENAKIPARLRSESNRVALPATALPVALGPALLHRQALAAVRSWTTLIPGAPQPTVRRTLFVHRNRMGIRTTSTPANDADLLAWLWRVRKALADRIRHLEQAAEIHAGALDLVAAIEATIDRRDPDEFAGLCDATGVHVHQLRITGPACTGLTCPHPSCEAVRQERAMISAVAGECGGELAAPTGATEVNCPRCGTRYDIAEQRAKVADRIGDRLGTVREVTGFLRSLELDVTVDKIDGWLRRGRIVDHGTGPTGRLVRVGEVRAYAEAQADRAKARRNVRVSA